VTQMKISPMEGGDHAVTGERDHGGKGQSQVPNDNDQNISTTAHNKEQHLLDTIPHALRRSNHIPQPSAAGAAMRNIPHTSHTQRTVQDIIEASNRA
jgi:hypothetical protein